MAAIAIFVFNSPLPLAIPVGRRLSNNPPQTFSIPSVDDILRCQGHPLHPRRSQGQSCGCHAGLRHTALGGVLPDGVQRHACRAGRPGHGAHGTGHAADSLAWEHPVALTPRQSNDYPLPAWSDTLVYQSLDWGGGRSPPALGNLCWFGVLIIPYCGQTAHRQMETSPRVRFF